MVERAPDLVDLNPEFSSRLDAFKAALDKAGISYTINSGYRSPEYQNRMYANHLAKQAGQPLPYPNDEAPGVVAAPWRSFHNYGLATDFTLKNPADYARLASMAPQFGLTGIGSSDPGHIQLAGDLASDVNQYHLASWRPSSQPAPASGAIAYSAPTGQPSRVATTTLGTSLNSTPMDIVLNAESGDRNIPNVHATTSSGQAQGNAQITTGTWTDFAPKAGVDLKQYPTPMDAPRDVQIKVASIIPLNRWAPSTVDAVLAKYPGIDTAQPLGAIQSAAINPGAAKTSAAPPNPFTAFAPGGVAAPGGAVATSLTNLDKALGGQQPGQQQQGGQAPGIQPSPMIQGPGAVNVSPLFNPLLGQQMMAQLSRAPARPAQQAPIGTTLNSMAMLDTSPVQFPQVYPSQMGYGGAGYGMGSMSLDGYPSSGGYGYGG